MPRILIAALAAVAVAQTQRVNFTSYTDDACKTVKTETKEFKSGACKKGTIYTCVPNAAGTPGIVNATYFNDDTCSSFNSSKAFDDGKCTQTGPKTARTSKLAVCW